MVDFDITAVIPARKGSSRIENKVFQEIAAQETLLGRKIKQLRELLPRERVVVNTESDEIANLAEKIGATVHYRDPYFAEGHLATFSELIVHVVGNINSEHIAWTPFVVPFFDAEQFSASFESYEKEVIKGSYDSLVSVVPFKEFLWDINGPLNYSATKDHTISQDLPAWYKVSNGNYMAPKEKILEWKYLLGEQVFLDEREPYCGIDIDTLHDMNLARAYEKVVRGML